MTRRTLLPFPSDGATVGQEPATVGGRRHDVGAQMEGERVPHSRSTGLLIQLLGRPSLQVDGASPHRFRSRKSWAVLAFLLLGERPPARSALASLLFADADDPLGALRWSLAEVRRGLGPASSLEGDPVRLTLPPGATVDVDVLEHGHWRDAVALPGLGGELLDGLSLSNAPAFESWLLSERRRVSAATESILHEAALGHLARDELERARDLALQATLMSPLDENHQALLIRLYRLAGEDRAAEQQFAAWTLTAAREFGTPPGAAVRLAMRERRRASDVVDVTSVRAITEAGRAAVAAGAVDAGVASFETAVRLADRDGTPHLRVETRLVLGEALIHALGGLDEEGVANLTEAERIALAAGDAEPAARARTELGYVDFLRARYDRAERRLEQVLAQGAAAPSTRAKAMTYLGSVASDRGDYPRATTLLHQAARDLGAAGTVRPLAYALSMLGRISLLRGDLPGAAGQLREAMDLAEHDHWLSFLPWPQSLLGHAQLGQGDVARAARTLEQAFARACQIGDPCWEGISARGMALAAAASGDVASAFAALVDARARSQRLADPYVWLDIYILDALCELGRAQDHPGTDGWVRQMCDRASRAGIRELRVRALVHSASLGSTGDAALAAVLSEDIDNPSLEPLIASVRSLIASR